MRAVQRLPVSRIPVSRILMIRMGAMGDIVHTLPSAATLRWTFPDAEIDWLVEEHWSPLLDGNPHITQARKLRKRDSGSLWKMIGELRDRHYDRVIDFQGLMKSAAIARLSGAAEVVGFETEALREKLAAVAYHRQVSVPVNAHVIDQNLALTEAPERVMEFPLPVGDPVDRDFLAGDFIAISPSAGWAAKRWPPEQFAALIKRVKREMGWSTLVNCGPGDEEITAEVIRLSGNDATAVRGGIHGLIGVARAARAFVAGDTGPLHIAAAVGTPVVGIFGTTSPQRNGPYSKRSRVVRARGVETTYSRSAGAEDIARVTVDEVFSALSDVTREVSK